jgi:hypothetical protein
MTYATPARYIPAGVEVPVPAERENGCKPVAVLLEEKP